MKKFFLIAFTLMMLAGCAATGPVVENNRFESGNGLAVAVAEDFAYLGEIDGVQVFVKADENKSVKEMVLIEQAGKAVEGKDVTVGGKEFKENFFEAQQDALKAGVYGKIAGKGYSYDNFFIFRSLIAQDGTAINYGVNRSLNTEPKESLFGLHLFVRFRTAEAVSVH